MNEYQQSFKRQFKKKHGDHVLDEESNMYIFADGAQMEDTGMELGLTVEPSEDRFERAQYIALYWKLKVEIASEEFDIFKEALEGDGCIPSDMDEEEQLQHLEKLQRQVRAMQKKHREAKKKVKEEEPSWRAAKRKAARRADVRARQDRQEFRNRIKQIEI